MKKKNLNIGVVGLGIGEYHIQGYKKNPNVTVAAICDASNQKLQAIGDIYGIEKRFTDFNRMLKEAKLDAVSVALPNKLHAPFSILALEAGIHVLCEKPMAINSLEAEDMLKASKRSGKNLMINFSARFKNESFALKRQIEAGVLGHIYFGRTVWHRRRINPGLPAWFTDKDISGGGPLFDLGVHRIDLAIWLMGEPKPVSVFGSTYDLLGKEHSSKTNTKFNVEDLACGIIKFDNGATLIVETSYALNIKEQDHIVTQLYGTKAGCLQEYITGNPAWTTEIYTEETGALFTKSLDLNSVPVPNYTDEFINSILEERPPMATGEQGLQITKIIEAFYQSASSGKLITL